MVLGGVEMKKSLFCRTFFYEILEALGYDSVTKDIPVRIYLKNMNLKNKYETPVRIHLKNVYATLTLATIAASVGGYAHMFSTFISSGFMTFLSAIWVLILLIFTPYDGKNQLQRLSLLGIFAFLTGCNLGPFLNLAVTINPALVLQALLGASVIFACFSLSALYAPDGHYLYLRGTLMSVLLTLIWVSIYNIFFGSQLLFKVSLIMEIANLYIGLAVMCGFIVYDTQFIVERARRGDMDYVMHSLNLFVDFVGVFWRLLMILTNKVKHLFEDLLYCHFYC
nr:probable Bax inhibitor 1 [Penaeus vannamei]